MMKIAQYELLVSFVPPEQLGQAVRIRPSVMLWGPLYFKFDARISFGYRQKPPPSRNYRSGLLEIFSCRHNSGVVKNFSVLFDLPRETVEVIPRRFNFVSAQRAVYQTQIHASSTDAHGKLRPDAVRDRIRVVLPDPVDECFADVRVEHVGHATCTAMEVAACS